MTFRGATRALAASAALALTAVGALAPAHAGQQRAGDPMAGAPTVGTCSTMTPKQAAAPSDHSTAVPCPKAHTAEVAGVVTVPDSLDWKTATVTDLFRVIAAKCRPKVDAMLGRDPSTRDSSAYHYVWFTPTKAQKSQGARWMSCSVVMYAGASLASLPTSTTPFLPHGALPDKVARCLTRSVRNTPCSATHLWRATGTFTVSGAYPGTRVLNKRATAKCRSRVQAGKAYRWTYQDKISWNVARDHVVVCYSRTRG
jgi:hypothetical protein